MKKIKDNKIKKYSQYNFQRVNYAPEEIGTYNENIPSSFHELHNIVLMTNKPLSNKEDEKELFNFWKTSKLNEENIVTEIDKKRALQLMNRGYLIETQSGFKLTEKGKGCIVSNILSEKPFESNEEMVKTCQVKPEVVNSTGKINYGGVYFDIHAPILDKNGNITGYIVRRDNKKLKEVREEKGLPIKVLNNMFLKIENNSFISNPSTEYENIEENNFVNQQMENPQQGGSQNIPRSIAVKKILTKTASVKLIGLLKTSNNKTVNAEIRKELDDRRLKVVMVADNSALQAKGLQFHSGLKNNECALFVFDKPGRYLFWNQHVSFPIDVAFFNSSGKLITICSLEKQQLESVGHEANSTKYVVEANKGWFKNNNINSETNLFDLLDRNDRN